MSELRDPPASGTLAAVEITIVKAQTGPDRAVVAARERKQSSSPCTTTARHCRTTSSTTSSKTNSGWNSAFGASCPPAPNCSRCRPTALATTDTSHPPTTVTAHLDDLLAAEELIAAFSALPGTETEPDLEPGQIERTRARMAELNERWQATGPGDVVQLRWPGEHHPPPDHHR